MALDADTLRTLSSHDIQSAMLTQLLVRTCCLWMSRAVCKSWWQIFKNHGTLLKIAKFMAAIYGHLVLIKHLTETELEWFWDSEVKGEGHRVNNTTQ